MASPAPPQKSETVLEVPDEVHKSRYRAMEDKKRESKPDAQKSISVSESVEPKQTEESAAGVRSAKENAPPSEPADKSAPAASHPPSRVPEEKRGDKIHAVKGDGLESDQVKLERKRKQQQKREEFLQQFKKRCSEENVTSRTDFTVKAEPPSLIAEGC